MPVDIHIEPQFAHIRAQMRRYPPHVIDRATVRTLNRLGAQARRTALRTIAREHRTRQKNLSKRIILNRATRQQHRVIIGFAMSRGSASESRGGSPLITPGSLFRHLETQALHTRLLKDPRYHGRNPGTLPFIQRPRGYRIALERVEKERYPLSAIRVDLGPTWRRLQSQLRARASSDFPREWTRNADHYKRRSNLP
jgi:hypothetical protein